MNTLNVYYRANNGSDKLIENVSSDCNEKFYANGRYYQINNDGQYALLQQNISGKCNTFWRTIGRYPKMVVTGSKQELEILVRKYTAFKSFDDLVNAAGNYTPTIRLDVYEQMRPIAEAYNAAQIDAGSLKRAYVIYPKKETQARDKQWREEYKLACAIDRDRRIAAQELKTMDNAHAEALDVNAKHITTRHTVALRINESKDRKAAARTKMLNPTTPVELAKTVKYLAKEMMHDARISNRYIGRPHFTYRGIEVLAITNGERTGNGEPEFLEMKDISGKTLKEVAAGLVKYFDDETVEEICIQGGLDCYENFKEFMKAAREGYQLDYDPMVEEFDVTVPLSLFK